MRKIVLALAAVAAIGIALPVAATTPADAATVVIKKSNNGHHYGWRHRRDRVVVRDGWRHRQHRSHRGATIVVR